MSAREFPPVPGGYPFPAIEAEILGRWDEERIFSRSLAQTAGKPRFVFYEGPPTANNKPHVGHVVTRVVKDLFPRFRTMQGYHVRRKAGWDTHGLPVEIEVEKTLGFSGKQEIEAYGIEAFNRACLESVDTYERQWREMSRRVGFWIDLNDAYFTYTNEYVESVWWALSELWKKGLLDEGYKIQPYCARCGTTLSSHEVAQNYQDLEDPSVWVLFPARGGQRLEMSDGRMLDIDGSLSLVAWTTTPWTVLAHVGLTVHPELTYRIVEHPHARGRRLLFADGLEKPVPLEVEIEGKRRRLDLREQPVLASVRGSELVGLRYDRPFRVPADSVPAPDSPSDETGWRVVAGDYVTLSEGTGLVHTAPLFGEDDYHTGLANDLPLILVVDKDGKIVSKPDIEPFAGIWFKEADPAIVRELRDRGRLLHAERVHHNYPFCWRCDQPLIYYASKSWFVRTTLARDRLIELNREIGWQPPHIREGRFGKWLENVVDWALSRSRYWGTPLPVWKCDACDHVEVIGSYRELFTQAGRDLPDNPYDRRQFDPHRPFIDRGAEPAFEWPCAECKGTMGRVDDVIDAWFDSGSMPFAQHHYLGEPLDEFDPAVGRGFPADFIAEAVDQTRGWFYTLHVLGVLLFDSVAYRNCIVLGHVNDESGRKMSKRLGNVVDPMEVLEETGTDALRWYFCISNPEVNSRFSARLVREAAKAFLIPLWNALSFFTIYANLDGWRPGQSRVPFVERPALDRWILLRLDRLTAEMTETLEGYRVTPAARAVEVFVDDLTNWYIRRSRDRYWASRDRGEDKEAAYQTLYEALTTLARLIAPFTPFVADALHANLVRSQHEDAPASVHLEPWPTVVGDRADEALEAGIAAVQRIVGLGRAARNSHGLKTRQPLACVTVVTSDPTLRGLVEPHTDLLLDELNVRAIDWAEDRTAYVHHDVRPVFPKTGPRFGNRMPLVKRALEEADGEALAAQLEAEERVLLHVAGEEVALSTEEVEVVLIEREGTATQGDRELLVALETELTPELVAEGRAREVVHRVQQARKQAGLDYADRIRVEYQASDDLEAAIDAHRDWISAETLALSLNVVDGAQDLTSAAVEDLSFSFRIRKENQGDA